MNERVKSISQMELPFVPGQKVRTSFGPGVVSAFSEIDSIVYVIFKGRSGLYLMRPEQVEKIDNDRLERL